MQNKNIGIFYALCFFLVGLVAAGEASIKANSAAQPGVAPPDISAPAVEVARYDDEFSVARVEPALMGSKSGIVVIFEGTDDLHYYANPETAPAPELQLKVEAKSEQFQFDEPVLPKWEIFNDPSGQKVEVYVGKFTIFVPILSARTPTKTTDLDEGNVEVKISGIACTSMACLPPFEKTLQTRIDLSQSDSWKKIAFEAMDEADEDATAKVAIKGPSYSIWFALGLALVAGLSLNIMPCIWPVLPLIVMRIVEQAKQSKGRSMSMGLAFCVGILLFFACLAGASIILRIFYGTVLQWGDQFRNPSFVAAMALLLVALALYMFDVFTISVPSSIAGKSGAGQGYSGAVGMGFLAAILSTPCSFGILAAAFAWAQVQPLLLATIAIMAIGIGMAIPYAVLTSMPGLLKRLPKAGRWMELFKQMVGFLLLLIAVKLITALPETRIAGVLYFGVILAFCIWMWSKWVSFGTKPMRKWTIRIVAAIVAIAGGWTFISPPADELINWHSYDSVSIEKALQQERPVLIEFTADWCLSCKTVERLVYGREDIAGLIKEKDVLAIKADTTEKDSPATLALKNTYNEPGVPVSMLLVPGQQEPIKWRGILFARELEKALTNLAN